MTHPAPKPTATATSTRQHVIRAEAQLDDARRPTERDAMVAHAQVAAAHALIAIAKLLDEMVEEIAQLRELTGQAAAAVEEGGSR